MLAALLALCAAPLPVLAVSSETHVEFNLSSTERVGGVNSVLTDTNLPTGVNGSSSAIDTGNITAPSATTTSRCRPPSTRRTA